jgi:hypothetical protein
MSVFLLAQGPGSFVIITTRDREALDHIACTYMHRVNFLTPASAYQLFMSNARQIPVHVAERLVTDLIDYCGGLPLSLKVSNLGRWTC